ncbi:MAG: UDP-glucose 4-epimerase GalE, partial [Clostridia bacterium]|nr:UDP-glucose 4-epimerase GalE [Clostridia bacterium]
MALLVTGGAGYIGSHACVELLAAGDKIVVVDNFLNSKPEVLKRIQEITGKTFKFYEVDLLEQEKLAQVFAENEIEAVLHFAGLKAVGESVQEPLRYYLNNITGTLILCEVMQKYGVKKLVFSSSATVYGVPQCVPVTEDCPLRAVNPYGRSKLMIEQILGDLYLADQEWSIALLRYFNPGGAHESGRIGEDPKRIPHNLLPYLTQVAVGQREKLRIFGNNYPTHDGTGVRDYLHVVDLAKGHLRALAKVRTMTGVEAYNLGTGAGYSVLDVLRSFTEATGQEVAYVVTERRPG